MILFYEFLGVAIGTRETLSYVPSTQDWNDIFLLAKKQALLGVCFNAIQRIHDLHPELEVNLPAKLRLQWVGIAIRIQVRNEELNKQCQIIQTKFLNAGLQSCILKGQGVASYYGAELTSFRQSGDIDIWIDGTWRQVMDYVNAETPNREFDMKHTHLLCFPNTIVEVHWWPSVPVNPLYRKRLQTYYKEHAPIQCNHRIKLADKITISAPDAKFEAIHIMYHIFNHFLYEGVGLRQMMDLYFVLTNGGLTQEDRMEVWATARKVGLASFAPAAMWVLISVFGMKSGFCICKPDSSTGQILFSEIERGGNFGSFSSENRVHNESFAHRMVRRLKRRLRLVIFNPIGLIASPFTKIKVLCWKHKVIRMYNL